MGISWDDAQTFLAVAEEQSFSGASNRLGVGQPTISRRIANLETRIGIQLFHRGRQGAQLTDEALQMLPAAEQMARWAAEFLRSTQTRETAISGTVRIAAPPGIAVEQLAPFAATVKDHYPDIALEVIAGVEHVDLTRGVADLAIRTIPPNEPELVTLNKSVSRVGVFARRDYVEKLTRPCTWSDVDWITWSQHFRTVAPRPMLERLIPEFKPAFTSDDYLVQKSALLAGMGAMIIGIAEAQSYKQDLVEIDMGVKLPSSDYYLVSAKSTQSVPRIQAIARLLGERIDAVNN